MFDDDETMKSLSFLFENYELFSASDLSSMLMLLCLLVEKSTLTLLSKNALANLFEMLR